MTVRSEEIHLKMSLTLDYISLYYIIKQVIQQVYEKVGQFVLQQLLCSVIFFFVKRDVCFLFFLFFFFFEAEKKTLFHLRLALSLNTSGSQRSAGEAANHLSEPQKKLSPGGGREEEELSCS